MKSKIFFNYLFCITIVVLYSACGSPTTEDETVTDSTPFIKQEKNTIIQKIFSSIPSQSETMRILDGAGAKYNSSLLNPIENISNYSSVKARAINLGVYGIDLGVTSLFDQTQESMLYLRCTNKLATSLGISGAFDESMTSRIGASSDNKDSLLAIIFESYRNADSYLQENAQPEISSLMIAGGWIEGMYISIQIANTTKTNNEAIIAIIAEEKETLDNLISLLESYKKTNEGTADILISLNELKNIYEEAISSDNKTTITLTPEQFKKISNKTTEIRNKIIRL